MARRLLQIVTVVCAVLALHGSTLAAVDIDGPALHVSALGDEYPALELALENLDRNGPAGRVRIDAPAGFELYPERPEGSIVGNGLIYVVDEAYGSTAFSLLRGQIVAHKLDAADRAAAQACTPAQPVAAWLLRLSLLGEPVDLPIYLSQEAGRTRLDLCVPRVSPTASFLPILSLQLILPELSAPRAAGAYTWQAIVTPLAPDRRTLLVDKAYEVRALVPVPHTLSLRGRYDAPRHRAVLHGRLTAAGKPRAGVRILFTGFIRRVTPGGIEFDDFFAGSTRTTASGAFSFRKRITRTTGFFAYVRDAAGACTGSALAPGGCVGMTTAGTSGEPITVSVPRR